LQDDYVKFLRFSQWKIQKTGYGVLGMITNHGFLDNPTFRGMRQSLMKTYDEIYILDLHGNSLKKERMPDGGKDENVFDIRQGVAISLFIKNKKPLGHKVFHKDLFGLREEKYRWLESNAFSKDDFVELKPEAPWHFFIPRHTEEIKHYLRWKSINEIFPINSTGIKTHRDHFVIEFDENTLRNRIVQFRNLSVPDEIIRQSYNLKDNRDWKLSEARKRMASDENWADSFQEIEYRLFDTRKICYSKILIDWPRLDVMKNILEKNIGLITCRQISSKAWQHSFISNKLVDDSTISNKTKERSYFYPLYIYPDKKSQETKPGVTMMMIFEPAEAYGKKANIEPHIFASLKKAYGADPAPEDILFYIYAVFYSNVFREKYAEFLKIDFPRVPFTSNYDLFLTFGKFGEQLADLHLLRSKTLEPPIAKFMGTGENDRIEKIKYSEDENCIYINDDKYFEGIESQVWNFHIGGYQVLQKYLKDRKGRLMDEAPRYCRIVTALSKTIQIQEKIDEIYPEVEKGLIEF